MIAPNIQTPIYNEVVAQHEQAHAELIHQQYLAG